MVVVAGIMALTYVRMNDGRGSGVTVTSEVLISLGLTPRILGPGTTMNYTLTLTPGTGAVGNASLSAESPQGLSVTVKPSTVVLTESSVAADVSIHASDTIVPGIYGIGITVTWPRGASNLTFQFMVVQHLVVLLGGSTGPGGFDPQSIGVRRGESVTWLSLDAGSDEYGGLRAVRIAGVNVTSPTLSLYSRWSYTFSAEGTYRIEDSLNPVLVSPGIIVVT